MKDIYKIFVEGVADKRFIIQLMSHIWSGSLIDEGNIIQTGGYTNPISKENLYINLMRRTADDGGINLVIFDADNDLEKRKNEILCWKTKMMVEFKLFLLPDNTGTGALEDLLERIINPENKVKEDVI